MTTSEYLAPCVGSEIKIEFTVILPDDYHLDDVDFTCMVYNILDEEKNIPFDKDDCSSITADTYMVCVDTTTLGSGEYALKIDVAIPDTDFDAEVRHEIVRMTTGIYVAE